MKNKITRRIREFVKDYQKNEAIATRWGDPLVGFADARHPYILSLKTIISQNHGLPTDVLSDASIVVAYFLPFTEELAKSNNGSPDLSSPQWALAYEETNALLSKINDCLIAELKAAGYHAGVSPESGRFDRENLISNWSQRHFAYAAGLGTFGLNNMLLTEVGGCGRFSSIVTNLDVEPDPVAAKENCLFKAKGICGACVKRCPSGALTVNGYDRHKCYQVCKKNAAVYTEFGSSYAGGAGGPENSVGSEVCGKCVTGVPCAFFHKSSVV